MATCSRTALVAAILLVSLILGYQQNTISVVADTGGFKNSQGRKMFKDNTIENQLKRAFIFIPKSPNPNPGVVVQYSPPPS